MSLRLRISGAGQHEEIRQSLEEHRAEVSSSQGAELVLVAEDGAEPSVATKLWQKCHDAELLIASRGASSGVWNRLYRKWLGLPYFDYTSSLRLYHASALRRAGAEVSRPLEALVKLHVGGFKIKELPAPTRAKETRPGIMELARLRSLRRSPDAADTEELSFDKHLKKRQEVIVSYLEVDVPFLDVGCGSDRLIQSVAKGVGLDGDVRKVRYLRNRAPAVVAGSVSSLPFRDESFPQLVCSKLKGAGSRETVRLGELRRVLRRGGTLVVGAPRAARSLRQDLEEQGFDIDAMKKVGRSEMVFRAIRR